jgi:pimeloyl-[acyl-carrier protein] methyl ester esterase
VFAHGWALNRSLWRDVVAELGDEADDAVVLDAGYYGQPAGPGPLDPARPLLGVGQSLGAVELLVDPPAPLAGLIAVDATARFSQAPDFPEGEPTPVLRYLVRRIRAGAGPAVADFLDRASGGLPAPVESLDAERLAAGLDHLISWDGRAAARHLPVWRLHAAHDPIAPLVRADASFADAPVRARVVREAADHLSPIAAPRACAELIRAALRDLSA